MAAAPKFWLKTLLPVAALAIVPLVGIVYASTASFGKAPVPEASASAGPLGSTKPITETEIPDDPILKPSHTTSKLPRPTSLLRGGAPGETKGPVPAGKSSSTRACCAKLAELAQSADPDSKATYSAAAASCNAAQTDDAALRQVNSIFEGTNASLPAECQGK